MKKLLFGAFLLAGVSIGFAKDNDISLKEKSVLVSVMNTNNTVISEDFYFLGNCNYVIRETTYWSDGSVTYQDHFFSKWADSEQGCRDMAQLHVNALNAGLDAPW